MTELRKIKRALISVSDKTGIIEFASYLNGLGVETISTGGTAQALRAGGLTVTDVSDITGFPDMMNGRIKTLHPKIHGAFLALRDNHEHIAAMHKHQIEPIDLVVVNLYPFEETVEKAGVSLDDAVENIDIGGPAMIRSAAKNWRDVAVVTDHRLYPEIVAEMSKNDGSLSLETRKAFAAMAYARTADYDRAITTYLVQTSEPQKPAGAPNKNIFSENQALKLAKITDLRYGENPHQRAALYKTGSEGHGIAGAEQLHGKEMSFNNYVDAEAAWNLVQDSDGLTVAIIKHTNPSGVGRGPTNEKAYRRALATDPVSAFGGIVAFNRKVDAAAASAVIGIFSEVIIAPDYDDEALQILKTKKKLRLLKIDIKDPAADGQQSKRLEYKQISGGFLVQEQNIYSLAESDFKTVTDRKPDESELDAMRFAWIVCKHVKSNAIVFGNENQTLGVGAGQMNRVDSVRIAAARAERFGLSLKGSVLASDAFFPFRDNVDEAAKFGVAAIIQPGGSIKDDESIAAANEHGIAMVFTGIRHFKH